MVEDGERDEMGFARELKLGQVPSFKCLEAVRDGFEAENKASQKEHQSFTALGIPVSVFVWMGLGGVFLWEGR
ncbi:hypothetical protein ACFX13_004823 [Malus domestica]